MRWKVLDSITRFQGFFRMVEYKYQLDRYDGKEMEMVREVFERGTAAGVLAYDPERDQVVLVEQFRSGAMHMENPWLQELIAGIVEEGESPEDVVTREAEEEAGCNISHPKLIAEYLPSPGGSTESVSVYVALCDSSQCASHGGLVDECEDIKTIVMSRQAFLQQMEDGKINNAMTLIAAQWLALNFENWKKAGYK